MNDPSPYTEPVWRTHGGRVRHRRHLERLGNRSAKRDEAACGFVGVRWRWEETGPVCPRCEAVAAREKEQG